MLRRNNIVLAAKNKIILANKNIIITNINPHLKLKLTKIDHRTNLEKMINTFQNHESDKRNYLTNFHSKSSVKFERVRELDVKKEILNLF